MFYFYKRSISLPQPCQGLHCGLEIIQQVGQETQLAAVVIAPTNIGFFARVDQCFDRTGKPCAGGDLLISSIRLVGLPIGIISPAANRPIRPQGTGMVVTSAHLAEGAGQRR